MRAKKVQIVTLLSADFDMLTCQMLPNQHQTLMYATDTHTRTRTRTRTHTNTHTHTHTLLDGALQMSSKEEHGRGLGNVLMLAKKQISSDLGCLHSFTLN